MLADAGIIGAIAIGIGIGLFLMYGYFKTFR